MVARIPLHALTRAALEDAGRKGIPRRANPGAAEAPVISAVQFQGSTVRSGNVIVARLRGTQLDPYAVQCIPESPGFALEVLPERTMQSGELLLGLRLYRRIGTARGLCRVRFSIGDVSVMTSITVLHD